MTESAVLAAAFAAHDRDRTRRRAPERGRPRAERRRNCRRPRCARAGIADPVRRRCSSRSTVASSSFLTKANLLNILDQQSATLIIAAAGTLVLVAGGIDLSVGAVYALAGVTAAELAQHGSPARRDRCSASRSGSPSASSTASSRAASASTR